MLIQNKIKFNFREFVLVILKKKSVQYRGNCCEWGICRVQF